MEASNCTLFHTGLKGAEDYFGQMAEKYGVKEIVYSYEGHTPYRAKNVKVLTEEELKRGDISMEIVSKMLNRKFYEADKIRKVLQLIFHMVNNGHQVFVIGTILDDNRVKGGTGWAVELAKLFNRPLHVFDQAKDKWFTWEKGAWQEEDQPKIEYDTFVGSGTRYLEDSGREAIENLFKSSF